MHLHAKLTHKSSDIFHRLPVWQYLRNLKLPPPAPFLPPPCTDQPSPVIHKPPTVPMCVLFQGGANTADVLALRAATCLAQDRPFVVVFHLSVIGKSRTSCSWGTSVNTLGLYLLHLLFATLLMEVCGNAGLAELHTAHLYFTSMSTSSMESLQVKWNVSCRSSSYCYNTWSSQAQRYLNVCVLAMRISLLWVPLLWWYLPLLHQVLTPAVAASPDALMVHFSVPCPECILQSDRSLKAKVIGPAPVGSLPSFVWSTDHLFPSAGFLYPASRPDTNERKLIFIILRRRWVSFELSMLPGKTECLPCDSQFLDFG